MFRELVGLAFAAGLVAALNPCGFALLPAYLTFVVGDSAPGRPVAVARAIAVTVAMTVGFLTVFAVFGALTIPLASAIQRYLPVVTVVVGVVLIALGLWLLTGHELRIPTTPPHDLAPTERLGSMFGYGAAYADPEGPLRSDLLPIELMLDDNGSITPDFGDEVVAAACVTRTEQEVSA